MIGMQLLIKLEILGNLAYVNRGVDWIVWVLHEVAGGLYPAPQIPVDSSEIIFG